MRQTIQARIPAHEPATTNYRVQRDGLTPAVRCLALAKQNVAKVSIVEINADQLINTCDEVEVLASCAATLRAAADHCDALAAPRVQHLYTTVRDADEVLTPLAKRDPVLTEKITQVFDYSKGRFLRAVKSRKANAARDQRTRGEVKEELGEEVRAEVREEMVRSALDKTTDEAAAPARPTLPRAPRRTEDTTGAAARTRRRPRRG